MRKLLLLSSFALLGSFAMANNQESKNYSIDYAPEGGWCTVTIYGQYGNIVYQETSWQPSYGDCVAWAAGRIFIWRSSLQPAV